MDYLPGAEESDAADVFALGDAINYHKGKRAEAFEICSYCGHGGGGASRYKGVGVADDIYILNALAKLTQMTYEGDGGEIIGADDAAKGGALVLFVKIPEAILKRAVVFKDGIRLSARSQKGLLFEAIGCGTGIEGIKSRAAVTLLREESHYFIHRSVNILGHAADTVFAVALRLIAEDYWMLARGFCAIYGKIEPFGLRAHDKYRAVVARALYVANIGGKGKADALFTRLALQSLHYFAAPDRYFVVFFYDN